MFFSSWNWMKTWETPSAETERSSSMPAMVLTARSILSVISVSTSSGAAPGSRVVTVTMGKSTLREAVDAELEVGEDADDHQREDEHRGEDRALDADLGEPLHGYLPPAARSATGTPSPSVVGALVTTRSPALSPRRTSTCPSTARPS